MKNTLTLLFALLLTINADAKKPVQELWPDGTPIDVWFSQVASVDYKQLGKQYRVTDYGIVNDGKVHTAELQALIDRVAADGGGVIVVPGGTYITGAIFFRQGTHLHLEQGAVLMGSNNINDYPVMKTRIEGESCMYYPATINADGLDGFTITGSGTLDGNGFDYWKAFGSVVLGILSVRTRTNSGRACSSSQIVRMSRLKALQFRTVHFGQRIFTRAIM